MDSEGYDDPARPEECPCCHRRVHKVPFTVWTDVDDFARFGVGYSLYYRTLIFIMYFLAAQLAFVTFYASATDMPATRPYRDAFYDNFLFFSFLCFVHYLRYRVMKYYGALLGRIDPNIAEFSVALSGLPRGENLLRVEEDLRELFEGLNHYNGVDHAVQDVVFLFQTADYTRALDEQDGWKTELLAHNDPETAETGDDGPARALARRNARELCARRIGELEARLLATEQEFREALTEGRPTARFMGKAIVVFKTQLAAYDVLEKYDVENPLLYQAILAGLLYLRGWLGYGRAAGLPLLRPLLQSEHFVDRDQIIVFRQPQRLRLRFRGAGVFVIRAVNPGNILWHHFGYTFWQKYLIRAAFFSFSLAILGLSFALVRAINDRRFAYFRAHEVGRVRRFLLNGVISLSILTFNNILNQFVIHTVRFEWHEKRTNELVSMIRKIVLKMFLNTTVMLVLIASLSGTFDAGFLAYQVLLMAAITALVSPLAGFWDFSYFVKLFRRYALARSDRVTHSQAYLSRVWENPEYNIVLNYSGFVFHFLNLAFYASFFPFWLFALILLYYLYNFALQKWLFVRRNSVINAFRNEVNAAVLNILDFAPALVLAAQRLRDAALPSGADHSAFFWAKAVLAAWTVLFPNERLIDHFFLRSFRNFGKFETHRELFRARNYTRPNPAYAALLRQRGFG